MNKHHLINDYYIVHRTELLGFIVSRTGGSMVAEDILQNVFLRLLTTDKMISETTLPALVYTTARHLITDYYRRRRTHEEAEHYIKHTGAESVSAESVCSAHEMIERIERGLARLPENCREVYRLHVYDGMKVSEISQQLGEGYKSVEHRLGTARKAIREYMRHTG